VRCYVVSLILLLFFFFQAEDGIRDFHVTGVQTCALPILHSVGTAEPVTAPNWSGAPIVAFVPELVVVAPKTSAWISAYVSDCIRSEERRVGKECRGRGSTEHEKKNWYNKYGEASLEWKTA